MEKEQLIFVIVLLFLLVIGLLIAFLSTVTKSKEEPYKEPEKDPNEYGGTGNLGEILVKDALEDICFYKGGYTYQGLKLEDEYGNWTEIDNIYISAYGVFIIETKFMKGRITGNPNSPKWQQIFKGGRIKEFKNPLIQNKRHIAFLQRVFPDIFNITPLVVFVDPANLGGLPHIDGVMKLSQLENYIDGCRKIYRDSKVEHINKEIKQYIDNPPFTHEEYANWVKEMFYQN